jgi:Mg-chelatase subunit ChlD
MVSGCAGDPADGLSVDAAVSSAPDGAAGTLPTTPLASMPACSADNPYCSTANTAPTAVCANAPIALDPVGVNVMIGIDGSASMATHWPRIVDAVRGLARSHPDSAFGLQIFWGELQNSQQTAQSKNNWCGETQNRVLDVGVHAEQELVDFLGTAPPGPEFLGGLFETSPVVEPINYYLSHASKLADPARTNYLVLITDGQDNCFGSVFAQKTDKLLAYQKLAVELGKLGIRTVPVGFDAATRPDSSGNYGTTPPNTDLEVLGTLLQYGGSGLTEVPKADNPEKLAEAIAQVGQRIRSCRFGIPGALDPSANLNPFQLGFSLNGKGLARDRGHGDGWDFVGGDTSQVELFGNACAALRSGLPLTAQKTCAEDVCGTAAIRVETKPRAVLFLLDASGSRIECADGSFDCLIAPGLGIPRTPAFWEVVEHAVGESLVAPVNDDVEFGMQFFPGKDAANFSCDVSAEAEIAPAQGTEITIMSQMLEKVPLGFSPVVQVLENVAEHPGRLAEPNVLGNVVMVTDGGDNCAGDEQPQIVARLRAAAQKLFDAGVRTHVVRYGSASGRTPEQEDQLRAIAEAGGTAVQDPARPAAPPYVDARSVDELNAALAAISDKLATCSFGLTGLPDDADRAKANLYLNGEVIPFDSSGTKRNGWAYIDSERSVVELYGAACKAFKENRRTSIVVELGCAQVLLR